MIHSKSYRTYQFVINFIMCIVVLIMVLPLVLLFMSSVTSDSALVRYGYSFFPKEFSLNAYRYIFASGNTIFRAYGMTILVTVMGTVINLFLSSGMAYALSDKKLPGRNLISFYVFFTMLFNGGLVPSYLMWTSTFHIKNTIWALVVPNLMMSAMNVILIRTYFMTSIPDTLYEAAKIDGATVFRIFYQIALPLGKPILMAMGIFTALAYWNDWTNGLYYVSEAKYFTVQLLLNKMIKDIQALQQHASGTGAKALMQIPQVSIRMAIAFVALLPILVSYPFLQKYFAEGIALGAVKG